MLEFQKEQPAIIATTKISLLTFVPYSQKKMEKLTNTTGLNVVHAEQDLISDKNKTKQDSSLNGMLNLKNLAAITRKQNNKTTTTELFEIQEVKMNYSNFIVKALIDQINNELAKGRLTTAIELTDCFTPEQAQNFLGDYPYMPKEPNTY